MAWPGPEDPAHPPVEWWSRLARRRLRRWDRPALTRTLALSFVSLTVLLSGILLLLYSPLRPGVSPSASSPHSPLEPLADFVYPSNLTIDYVGTTGGYFGNATLPFCGNAARCALPPGGHYTVSPGSDLSVTITLANRDAASGHWVQVVTVQAPFQLEDVYPALPMEYCAGCPSASLTLLLLAPPGAGSYLLVVTAVSFD